MQVGLPRDFDARQRPQKRGIGKKKSAGEIAIVNQPARAVHIFEKQVEQLSALDDAGFNVAPLFRRDQQRDGIDGPGVRLRRPEGRCRYCK